MTKNLIVLQGLSKSFQKEDQLITVLENVSLEIGYKESLAIVGASGSGKSTFLQLLGMLDKPDKGTIIIGGKDTQQMSGYQIDRLRNAELGFIFQFHHLLPDHNALFNVMMPLLIRGESIAKAKPVASELLKRVGLESRMNHLPGELSGGEQQRVAVARALVGGPKIVLADEPTGNLDPDTSKSIMSLLTQLTEEIGGTLVIVTHNLKLAHTCSRVLRLDAGSFVEDVQ